jgi:hypothetical protein
MSAASVTGDPESATNILSPFFSDWTATTVVNVSGLKADFRLLSHAMGAPSAAKTGDAALEIARISAVTLAHLTFVSKIFMNTVL